MATSESTIQFILDQLSSLPSVRVRKMFGEYALYCDEKVVALVCDNTLFIKITPEGRKLLGSRYKEGFAYKGAKASMEIGADDLDDRDLLAKLIKLTAKNLPAPKEKKIKKENKKPSREGARSIR